MRGIDESARGAVTQWRLGAAAAGLAIILITVPAEPARAAPARARPEGIRPAPPRRAEAARSRRPSARELAAAKARFRQGKAYYEAGAYAEAAREYEAAYALAPLPDLLFNVAQAYRMMGDKPKGIAAYERYLAVVSEGALADEARAHVASLRLKIQVEDAEAARKKAIEEAAAAKKRAAELEEARRRAEADAEARRKAQHDDAGRLRRLAADVAEKERERRAAEQREYLKTKTEAEAKGRHLRRAGRAALILGSTGVVLSILPIVMMIQTDDKLKGWDNSQERWSKGWESRIKERRLFTSLSYGWTIGGGVVLIAGIVLHRVGIYLGKKATDALVPPVALLPLVGPGEAGLSLGGRF